VAGDNNYWVALDVSAGGSYMVAWVRSVVGSQVVATSLAADGIVIAQSVLPVAPQGGDGFLDVFVFAAQQYIPGGVDIWLARIGRPRHCAER
jgi:hypothetical protein